MSTVFDKTGRKGHVVRAPGGPASPASTATVALPDGSEAEVPAAWLQARGDAYYLPVAFDELGGRQSEDESSTATIPLAEETLHLSKRIAENVVRLRKVVREHEELLTQSLAREDVEIERVAVNQPVEGQVGAREEGDALIIPLLEEEIVWHKRLVVREELRIRKRRRMEPEEVRVPLRREEIIVEREDKKP